MVRSTTVVVFSAGKLESASKAETGLRAVHGEDTKETSTVKSQHSILHMEKSGIGSQTLSSTCFVAENFVPG
jgi:hypothetical protein